MYVRVLSVSVGTYVLCVPCVPCVQCVPCVPCVLCVLCVPSVLRKLSEKHKNVEGKLERRDVIKDYSSYSSQVYAPMTRIGVFLDSNAHQYQVSSHYKDTLYGLLELEAGLPAALVRPKYVWHVVCNHIICTYIVPTYVRTYVWHVVCNHIICTVYLRTYVRTYVWHVVCNHIICIVYLHTYVRMA